MTTKAEAELPGEEAAAAGSLGGEEARGSNPDVGISVVLATMVLVDSVARAVADHGDEPALLVLHASVALSALLHLWARYLALLLRAAEDKDRRCHRGFRTALRVAVWATGEVLVAGLADMAIVTVAAFRTVAAMLVMLLVTLYFAARFGWCFGEYLRTRNSLDTAWASTLTSLEPEKLATATARDGSHDSFLHKKSSAKAKLAQAQESNDLEANLLIPEE